MTARPRSTRRSFLQSAAGLLIIGAGGGTGRAAQRATFYDVSEKSIGELQAAMAARRIDSAGLVKLYLSRIAAYDQTGPRLNAVLSVNPRALAEARVLDTERMRRGPRGPLHGIPVLLKDNFDTTGMPTTGGSLALSGFVPRKDAFQIKRLRQAGVVILGKVNLHELALGLTTVSSLGGQTLNPYDLRRAPGGSSGGSGVAVAACFAAFAMGTDTSGSIRIPSSHNSIVGLRPSAGLSSRAGIIPFGHTQDTGGPMARTVADIAAILDVTVGYDPDDPSTATATDRIPRTYTTALQETALNGSRIGVLNEFFGDSPDDQEVGAVIRRAIEEVKMQGATAVDVVVPDLSRLLMASNLLSQELKFYLGDYLKRTGGPVGSVEELLASGLHTSQFQGFLEGANKLSNDYLNSDDYKSRLAARLVLAQAILKVMDDNRLDALAYPTIRRIAPLVGGAQLGSNAGLSAQTGFPAISVPAGFTPDGFPVGIELLGRPFGEPTILGLAYAYERATRHRRPPAATQPLGKLAQNRTTDELRNADAGGLRFEGTATGAQSVPPSDVPFEARARFSFNGQTRRLGYDIRISGSRNEVLGVYLHRRVDRQNGGVAYILTKSPSSQVFGTLTLSEPEASDLMAGKFYISVISRRSPLLSARATIVLR